MKLFADNKEINIPPQWNVLTETNQTLQTITIPKGNYYPGNYQRGDWKARPLLEGLGTYSVYVVNKNNKYNILAEIDTQDAGIAYTNAIAPNSEGIIYATAKNIDGIFFKTNNDSAEVNVDEDVVFQIKEEKLEPGNIATAWMPAIADLMLKNQNGGVRQPATHS